MFLVAKSDLLDFLVRTLKVTHTLVINPNPDHRLSTLLHRHKPIFMRIHTHNVPRVTLQELLLAGFCVLADEDTPGAVVQVGVHEDEVGVVE